MIDENLALILFGVILFLLCGPVRPQEIWDFFTSTPASRQQHARREAAANRTWQSELPASTPSTKPASSPRETAQSSFDAASTDTTTDAVEHPDLAAQRIAERERRAAAVEARFNKDKTSQAQAAKTMTQRKRDKAETALERASRENYGWRVADQQHDVRAWN